LLENECTANTNGIYVAGSQNHISGNKLHGNTAPIGSAVLLANLASGNWFGFNSITVDPGTEPKLAAGEQLCNLNSAVQVSAAGNWWGYADGPANAGGQGPLVGEKVVYDPWLKVAPVRVKTVASSANEYTADAREETSTTVTKQGSGAPVITVASFAENPAGKFPTKPVGQWLDVLFCSADNLEGAEIDVFYTADQIAGVKEGSLRLYWWNGQKWKACSKSGVDKVSDLVWAKVNLKTRPGLNDLQGTFFAVGTSSGGMSWWTIPLIIVVVVVLLVVFRVLWVVLVKGERAV
jgi:parallel beta-helix repeat protein